MADATKLYPLIPSQETMCYMLKYSLHKQVTNVPMSLATEKPVDFDLLKKALNIEIARNDCLRLRFTKKRGKMMQYFLPEAPAADVPVLHFKTEQEQTAYFCADAEKAIRPLRETFRVKFFTDWKGRNGVYLNCCHLVMDASAATLFLRDLFAVYDALEQKTDMPAPLSSFEKYLPQEYAYIKDEGGRYSADRAYFEKFHRDMGCPPFYAGVHGPGLLEKQRRRHPDLTVPAAFDPIHDKAESLHLVMDEETTSAIYAYCKANRFAPEILFETGYKIHCARLNYRTDDTMMMVLCSRRVSKGARNMGGCLAQPLQMRTKIPTDLSFEETVKRASAIRGAHFRHMSFPYIDALEMEREIYHFSKIQGPALMMYTWLPMDAIKGRFPDAPDFRFYNPGRYILPLYTFSYPSTDGKRLECSYMYRTNLISEADIRYLHESSMRVLRYAIAHPDSTVSELFDYLDQTDGGTANG